MDSATASLLATSRRPARFAVMRQRWDDLFFYHWRGAPADVQASLPAGLTVDTFAGQVHHQPNALQRAEVQVWSEAPLAWNGFPSSGRAPDFAHACRGVTIEAFGLTPADA